MLHKAKWDIVAAGLLFALAVFVLITTSIGFGSPFADAGGVFPETLPRVYGVALLVLSLILGVESWMRRRAAKANELPDDADEKYEPPFSADLPWGRIFGTLAAIIIFAVVLPLAPFLPITAALLAGLFVLYGHRNYKTVLLVAGIGALAMDVLFIRILNLPI